MNARKVGALVMTGLLYSQCLLGAVAVAAVVAKQPAGWPSATEGYGVAQAAPQAGHRN